MQRNAIRSAMQFPCGCADGPIQFGTNYFGLLRTLQGELDWRLVDFCRIHQIVYKEISDIDIQLNALDVENIKLNGDMESYEELQKSRILDAVIAQDMQNKNVISFVDHMTIVGLWAIAEQFIGRIYREFRSRTDNCRPQDIKAPYRWDDVLSEFAAVGIDLTTCENFHNANECRVVNNSIKHDPIVGNRLIVFPYFVTYQGQKLDDVLLEMQRYTNGVSDFLGSLIEAATQRLEALGHSV